MSFRTVAEVKAFALQMLGEHEDDPVLSGSTDEDLANLAERWVQTAFDRVATYRDWEFLKGSVSLTWNGAGVLYLPNYVERLISPIVPSIGADPIRVVPSSEYDVYRDRVPGNYITVHGVYGVENDMGTAGTVTATSADAALAAGLQVRIEGLDANGYEQVVTLTLGALGTATSTETWKAGVGGVRFINIVPDTVPTGGDGIVTVTGGGVTLERLDPSRERAHQHVRTELHAISSTTGAIPCRYIRRAFNVTVATDLIPIPDQFHDLMELGLQCELEKKLRNYGNAAAVRAEWRERMTEFSAWSNRVHGGQRSVVAPRTMSSR